MAIDSYAPQWRVILDHPDYEVSDDGRIRRSTPTKFRKDVPYELNLAKDAHGYPQVGLYDRARNKFITKKIHRLVLKAFVGEPPTSSHVGAHGNGVKDDNRVSNLRWATGLENYEDAIRHDTWARGTRLPQSKLTPEIVQQLRTVNLRRGGQALIAEALGVSRSVVCEAISGKMWAHIMEQPK